MVINKTDSEVIAFLRTYMIFMVVFCHMNPSTTSLDVAEFPLFSPHGLTNAIGLGISYVLARTATPSYFLFSGYLFAKGLELWDWKVYNKKLRSRVKGLLVPFLSWQILAVLSFVLFYLIDGIQTGHPFGGVIGYLKSIDWHVLWDSKIWGTQKTNWFGYHLVESGPIDSPLWFVRDLMVVTLFAPALHYIFKKTRYWGMGLLLFCYITRVWPQIHGFSIDSFFYFGLGLFLFINGQSLTELTRKYRATLGIVGIISCLLCWYYGGKAGVYGQRFFPFFAISGVGCLINIATYLVEKKKMKVNHLLAQGSFFIYALHACPLAWIGSVMGLSFRWMSTITDVCHLPNIIAYLITPFLIAAISLVVYSVLQKFLPGVCGLLTGERNSKTKK